MHRKCIPQYAWRRYDYELGSSNLGVLAEADKVVMDDSFLAGKHIKSACTKSVHDLMAGQACFVEHFLPERLPAVDIETVLGVLKALPDRRRFKIVYRQLILRVLVGRSEIPNQAFLIAFMPECISSPLYEIAVGVKVRMFRNILGRIPSGQCIDTSNADNNQRNAERYGYTVLNTHYRKSSGTSSGPDPKPVERKRD
ncbi:predicted protein [Postia placenta Mad-698-R]|nr:predicted protein [Postia placenta Mad-698-R]